VEVDAEESVEVDVDAEEEVQVDSEAGDDRAQIEVEGRACRVGCFDPHVEPLEGRDKPGFPFGSVALLTDEDDLTPGLEVHLHACLEGRGRSRAGAGADGTGRVLSGDAIRALIESGDRFVRHLDGGGRPEGVPTAREPGRHRAPLLRERLHRH